MRGDGAIRRVAAVCAAIAAVATATPAAAAHRVAAVDPDEQLVRALEVALSPWDAAVVAVRVDEAAERPGATMPIAVDRARAIARDARADVLVWVSASDGGNALWIYDVDSDHASARALDMAPPFEPAIAAQVALAVKTLLRGTVVAPPPERFGAAMSEPTWILGGSAGGAARLSSSRLPEARLGIHASLWPAAAGHRWGIALDVEDGTGAHTLTGAFSGSLSDAAARLALGLRVPFGGTAPWAVLEPSAGVAAHLLTLDGVVIADAASVTVRRVDVAFEPRLAFDFAFLGGRLLAGPCLAASILGRWQRFFVHDTAVVEAGPVTLEGALELALALP
ncbi:MAG TPA: hypothetical protein VHV30_10740 [Polyangiaceae bacterium]|jgi:hypothetical protein|nr:hypothetical protein [Polyangiaceae bacterium]